jgi:hypothetical protein
MSNIVAAEIRWKVEERTSVAATSAQKSAVIGITTTSLHHDNEQESSSQPTHIRDMSRSRVVMSLDLQRDCRY